MSGGHEIIIKEWLYLVDYYHQMNHTWMTRRCVVCWLSPIDKEIRTIYNVLPLGVCLIWVMRRTRLKYPLCVALYIWQPTKN